MKAMTEYRELEQVLHALPPAALEELLSFASYLQYKHEQDQPGPVVKLGGLWASLGFDISDQDVRSLRHQLTLKLANGI
jgi:hypothetical protein